MAKSESNVDRIYEALRRMAADFAFKPDARINESALAQQLDASRTPIREALNRLVAEGFLTFQSGRGFFCRSLSPELVMDLYEARVAVEVEAVRLACARGSDQAIAALTRELDEIAPDYTPDADAESLLAMDERFHGQLCRLSGNAELCRILANLNDRIRYLRLIDLRRLRETASDERTMVSAHRGILDAVARRDADEAAARMRAHIERRREGATQAVRDAYAQLYVPDL
ncbi:GntR family transcriptional regulator [Ruegeria sediminis]|uniref:GntR family transcriptional regulator n=1 Tax=Ruegeria sediminis TaxID=2583820 RepID=A0ABY2X529_9RHOB|nr:GntR family transcriptional regulator [Ruegeria sediminis]TMV10074.1 GntR family transcriptional regulator [Ruegeria sediminis]